jgi:hypothetical protein
MNYHAGFFVRVLYCVALFGFAVAPGLLGFSWTALALGGPFFGVIGTLVVMCLLIFRVVQIFRNPQSLDIYAPNAALRFFRSAALFLMMVNVLALCAALFSASITNWIFSGKTGDNGIAYFAESVFLLLGLSLTSLGLVLFEVVRLVGNKYKPKADIAPQVAEQRVRGAFGVKYQVPLIVLVVLLMSWHFIPHSALAISPLSKIFTGSAPPGFNEVCAQTGITVINAPEQEVRSMFLSHGSGVNDGRFNYPIHEKNRSGPNYWGSNFIPELEVSSPFADVIVTYDADDRREASRPFAYRKLVRYTVTATDRRNRQVLGKMSYAIDIATGYACGANTPEGIDVNAFLRRVSALPETAVEPTAPVAKSMAEQENNQVLAPAKLIGLDQWPDELQSGSMFARCEAMLPMIGGSLRRFSETKHGLRFLNSAQSDHLICLDTAIFQLRNIGEMNHKPIQVNKYTLDGQHLYSLEVTTPDAGESKSFVVEKSLGVQDGFLQFEKWEAGQHGSSWELTKISKYRVAEPPELDPLNSMVSKEVPEWATFFHEENVEVEHEFLSDANSLVSINDIQKLAKDTVRRVQCDQMAPDIRDQFGTRRFAADVTGLAGMQKLGIADLCDEQGIWSLGQRVDQRGEVLLIQKYTPTGAPQFKVKFRAKAQDDNDVWVYLIEPSLRSQGGYLYFELWLCRPAKPTDGHGFVGDKYLALHHIAARVKQPEL